MSVGLLDVNMLVALGWSSHAHHSRASQWLIENLDTGWATCPITQCGFVRLSCNSALTPGAVSPADALRLLRQLTASEGHTFWPDDLTLENESIPAGILTGHRQVTDAYLLGLAKKHGGKLVTLDRKLRALAQSDSKLVEHLEIVE